MPRYAQIKAYCIEQVPEVAEKTVEKTNNLHTQKIHRKHNKNLLRLHLPKWSTPNDTVETKKLA